MSFRCSLLFDLRLYAAPILFVLLDSVYRTGIKAAVVQAFDPVAASHTISLGSTRKVCLVQDGAFFEESQRVAKELNIPVLSQLSNVSTKNENFSHALKFVPYESQIVSTYALAIEALSPSSSSKNASRRQKPKCKSSAMPFYIDFCPSKQSRAGKRSSRQSGSDLLLKAAALNKHKDGAILFDLTAGFGQDSVILALSSGARKVVMVERDPIVAALLDDALRRVHLLASLQSKEDEVATARDLSPRLSLVVGDGRDFKESSMEPDSLPDVVYLDPMFPPRTKSAAVKKHMQILHGLLDTQLSTDSDFSERELEEKRLLNAALGITKARVVVKRPIKAVPLGGDAADVPSPSYSVKGTTNRWDIYVK